MVKLKASTLIEVIISLVIISTIMTIALMTYSNVIQSDDLTRKTEANLFINKLTNEIKKDREYIDNVLEENKITYTISFTEYDKTKQLLLLEVVATTSNNRELMTYSEVILNE